MSAPRRSSLLKLFWRVHRWVYRKTGGRVGARLLGKPVLLMTTTGRKSGLPREITLYYLGYRDAFVVIASNAGHFKHPAWYLNLQANPEADLQAGRRRLSVRARTAGGDERALLWQRALELDPNYADYEQRTDREIPIVVLEPAA